MSKHLIKIVLFICQLFVVNQYMSAVTVEIRKGDTLWILSEKYQISVDDIIRINEMVDGESIYPGQKIEIPSDIIRYQVRKGDTLIGVARRFGASLGKIIVMNNLADENIYPGDFLRIPVDRKETVVGKKTEKVSVKEKYQSYEVRKGDSLSQIALDFGVTQKDIMQWNGKSTDRVFVGEKLIIYSDVKKEEEQRVNWIEYTVVKGDTLSGVAFKYGVTVNDLMKWNSKDSPLLFSGEILKIDREKLVFRAYNVKQGDSLSVIAYRLGVSLQQLKSWNSIDGEQIYPGQKINYLPNGKKTAEQGGQKKPQAVPEVNRKTSEKTPMLKDNPADDSLGFPFDRRMIESLIERNHGILFRIKGKSMIYHSTGGIVEYTGQIASYGNVVIVCVDGDRRIVYGLLDRIDVKEGSRVYKGDPVGETEKDSFYFEIRKEVKTVNILDLFTFLKKYR